MLAARLDDTQRPARTHESLQFRGNEHELTACSGEIRRCPRSRYQSAPGAKSSYRNRRVRGPFWCNPITLLDPRQPALTVGVRGPPGPAARVSQRGSTSAHPTDAAHPAPYAVSPTNAQCDEVTGVGRVVDSTREVQARVEDVSRTGL